MLSRPNGKAQLLHNDETENSRKEYCIMEQCKRSLRYYPYERIVIEYKEFTTQSFLRNAIESKRKTSNRIVCKVFLDKRRLSTRKSSNRIRSTRKTSTRNFSKRLKDNGKSQLHTSVDRKFADSTYVDCKCVPPPFAEENNATHQTAELCTKQNGKCTKAG